MTHIQLTHAQTKTATHRVALVREFESSGMDAKTFCAQTAGAPSWQTLYRWALAYRKEGYHALAPQYGKTRGRTSIDDTTLDYILKLYLTQNKLNLRYCVSIASEKLNKAISYDAVRRAVRLLPDAIIDKYRKGEKYFNDRHVAHIKRNYQHLKVMQSICMDHHLIDVFVRDGQKARRVWLTCAQDMRSRTIVAWRIVDSPNEITIAECLYDITTKHGVAEQFYIDNGKDFTSKLLAGDEKKRYKNKLKTLLIKDEKRQNEIEGIYASLGSRVVFATPYHPESKPIERFFKEVNQRFSRLFASYAGSNTADRPDQVKELWKKHKGNVVQLPTIDDVRNAFDTWLAWWHKTHKHTGSGMAGRTPLEVFETEARIPRIDIPREQMNVVFSRVEKRHVYQGAIVWDGVPYYADKLILYSGSQVECVRPIFDTSIVHIRDAQGHIVCTARANALLASGTSEQDLRALKKAKQGQKGALLPYGATGTYGDIPQLVSTTQVVEQPKIQQTKKRKSILFEE